MKKWFNIGLAFGLLLMLAGCDPEQSQPPATTPAPMPGEETTGETTGEITEADMTIEMINSQFIPQAIEVNAGDTVRWVNRDEVVHTIRASGFEQEVPPGGEYTFTFREEGIYYYESTEFPEMVGVVEVMSAEPGIEQAPGETPTDGIVDGTAGNVDPTTQDTSASQPGEAAPSMGSGVY